MITSNDTSFLGKSFGIYQIRNIKTGCVYIGSTIQSFRRRWNQHLLMLRRGVHDNTHLQRSWNIWGSDAFCFEVIEIVTAKETVTSREQFAVDDCVKRGVGLYNVSTVVNNPMRGRKHTDATKEKIRSKATGRTREGSWNKGMSMSEEFCQTVSKGIKAKFATPEMRKKLSETRSKKHSAESNAKTSERLKGDNNPAKRPEVRAKISASCKGRTPWNKGRRKING